METTDYLDEYEHEQVARNLKTPVARNQRLLQCKYPCVTKLTKGRAIFGVNGSWDPKL